MRDSDSTPLHNTESTSVMGHEQAALSSTEQKQQTSLLISRRSGASSG